MVYVDSFVYGVCHFGSIIGITDHGTPKPNPNPFNYEYQAKTDVSAALQI